MSSCQDIVKQTGKVTQSSADIYSFVGKITHVLPVLLNKSKAEFKRKKRTLSSVKEFPPP